MNKKPVKLTSSQKKLFNTIASDARAKIDSYTGTVNELVFFKLRDMAIENGIDIEDGDWRFNEKDLSFDPIEKPQPPRGTTVKKRDATKKTKVKED